MNQRYKPTVPKWLRRKLSAQQLEDLDLVHLQIVDALKVNEPDAAFMWLGSVLLYWKVSQHMRVGKEVMDDQLALADQLMWRSVGSADWTLLSCGAGYMRDLAELADRPLTSWCADWAQREAERRAAKADAANVNLEQA